ncbi:ParB/RepB/Spo0J family partition protein [Pseudokineococcus sp. 1T1Z-3]|uniref:ParB/RepB/Spo0J family partition protein n=1 Tax=Pseudokineococcus sp. 1T1Z-3 TaxID=3132745 RepID=UPI0030A6F456
MTDRRRGLGRGLGALIPAGPDGERPRDVFWQGSSGATAVAERPRSTWNETDGLAPGAADRPGSSDDGGDGQRAHGEGEDGRHAHADGLLDVPGVRLVEVPVDAIRPNPRQPRTEFDEDDLAELQQSIREVGVLQPVVVRPVPVDVPADGAGDLSGDDQEAPRERGETAPTVRFELVMGERRWRACREAGLATVPAVVRGTEDDALLRDALLENLHRSQLNPLEEGAAYSQLLEDFGCTHEELARRIGRSRPQITNTMRLLKLPPLVQRRVAAGVLSAGHARALLGLPDAAAMERLAQRVVAEGLSVRSTEEAVALGEEAPAPRRAAAPRARDERAEAVASALSERLETRVTVAMGRRKGRLSVEFAGAEDLERILAVLAPEMLDGQPVRGGGAGVGDAGGTAADPSPTDAV